MKIAVLFWPGMEDVPNRAINQRLSYLAARHELALFTSSNAEVAASLAAGLSWRRPPKLPALPRVLDANPFRVAWQAAAALWQIGWTVANLFAEPGLADGVVYTFHRPEAAIGRLAGRLGFLWIADLLDMPDLFVEDMWFKSTWDRRLRLRVFLYRHVFRLQTIFRHADLVFTPAYSTERGFGRRLIEEFGVEEQRLQLVTNGVDLGAVRPAGLRPPPDRFRLIHAGPVGDGRDTDILLQAFAQAVARAPELELLLAGIIDRGYEVRLRQHLSRIAEAAGRDDAARVLGFLPHREVLDLVEQSHAGLYIAPPTPTKQGAMPIKVLEYLALGRPVIATDLDGVRGMVQPGVNGLRIPPSDPRALAEAIVWCAAHPGEVERMGAAARAGLERFDWERINAGIHAAILGLVDASAAKRRWRRRVLAALARVLSGRPARCRRRSCTSWQPGPADR